MKKKFPFANNVKKLELNLLSAGLIFEKLLVVQFSRHRSTNFSRRPLILCHHVIFTQKLIVVSSLLESSLLLKK